MNSKYLNYIFLIIITALAITLFLVLDGQPKEAAADNKNHFLVNFDQADYERLAEMVDRFKEGKGDNLMLIPPIVDGGYTIHDVVSDGRKIRWSVDNTRDGMSSDRGQTEYVCYGIDIGSTESFYTFELSKCVNYDTAAKLSIISFSKDEL